MPISQTDLMKIHGYKIDHLYDYEPYKIGGQRNPNFDAKGKILLDLKCRYPNAIAHFEKCKIPNITVGDVVCVVPSHDPANVQCGTKDVALKKINKGIWIDGTDCLERIVKIQKLASGGNRSISVHLGSIVVKNAHKIKGKNVILLDDITTSGHSLKACKYLLLQAGAKSVECFAFGKTV